MSVGFFYIFFPFFFFVFSYRHLSFFFFFLNLRFRPLCFVCCFLNTNFFCNLQFSTTFKLYAFTPCTIFFFLFCGFVIYL
ncbi:hypothetical protein Hanom_Chr08g00732171 [Helianthus anomalus]